MQSYQNHSVQMKIETATTVVTVRSNRTNRSKAPSHRQEKRISNPIQSLNFSQISGFLAAISSVHEINPPPAATPTSAKPVYDDGN